MDGKNRTSVFIVINVFIAVILSQQAIASPWTRAGGRIFLESRIDYFTSERQPDFRFERLESNLYAEIGVAPHIMVGGKMSYGQSWIIDSGIASNISGFSEFEGFVQRTLWSGDKSVVSAKLSGGVSQRVEARDRSDLSSDGSDIELRLLAGRDLTKTPVKTFIAGEAAYRKRLGASADEVRLDGLVGLEPTPRLVVLGEVMASISTRNNISAGSDFDIVRIKPSLIFRLNTHWALRTSASFEIATRNLNPGRTFSVGIWSTF